MLNLVLGECVVASQRIAKFALLFLSPVSSAGETVFSFQSQVVNHSTSA